MSVDLDSQRFLHFNDLIDLPALRLEMHLGIHQGKTNSFYAAGKFYRLSGKKGLQSSIAYVFMIAKLPKGIRSPLLPEVTNAIVKVR
jgi:hypothetical protein